MGFILGLCLIQGTLSEIGEKMNSNTSSSFNNTNSIVHKIKYVVAKLFFPIILKPSSLFITKSLMKKMFAPIGQELVEGKNQIMNDRVLDLLIEADKKGLLDSL